MKVELVSVTPNPDQTIIYIARVSSQNQTNPNITRLTRYLIDKKHWSPFEHAFLTVEVKTSRGIAPQILRHRSFSFQEFSQRYAAVDASGIEIYAARRAGATNRQSSIDDLPVEIQEEWQRRQMDNWRYAFEHYTWALSNNIATECARFVLPLGTETRLYMSGSVRSWIHYIALRAAEDVQKEHRDIALAIRDIFVEQFPVTGRALGWLD
jgi:thymidylate synthase (FAD)